MPATLPSASTRMPVQSADGELITLPNVAVFAEHETTVQDGRRLKFDRRALQSVCDRCNQRIRETGDYAAVTIGHTPDPKNPNGKSPEVVGFAGPFRLGTMGQPGTRQRYAILADLHVYKDDYGKVRKNPRRSPELWLEESYDQMFLDPIALLGAEAPRLDMGMLYSANHHGRRVEKYAASFGGPMNASPRSEVTAKRNYDATTPGSPMAANLTPDDVRMIVDALEQLDWVQWAKGQMAESVGGPGTMPEDDLSAPSPDAGAPPPAAPPAVETPEMGAAPSESDADDPNKDYSALPPAQNRAMWSKVPPEKRKDGGTGPYDDMDSEWDRHGIKKNAAGMKPYAAEPATGSVDGDDGAPGKGDVDQDGTDSAAGEYQKQPEKFAKRFEAMSNEVVKLREQVKRERYERIQSERYARIAELHNFYAFDLETESKDCDPGKMTDEQFVRQLAKIERYYKPRHVGVELYTEDQAGMADAPERGGRRLTEKYSKDNAERAVKICLDAQRAGKSVDYKAVLDDLANGREPKIA